MEKIDKSEERCKELEDRANYQEDYNRRNNLQIVGVEEPSEGETWEQTAVKVSELLTNKLELPNIELERAHRVGQRDAHRHRTIVARFTRYGDREAVMRNVTKLKGTRIYITEDLCPASQNIRKAQIPAMKQAKSEGKVAYFRHTKLIIKERPNSGGSSRRVITTSASTHGSSDRPDTCRVAAAQWAATAVWWLLKAGTHFPMRIVLSPTPRWLLLLTAHLL